MKRTILKLRLLGLTALVALTAPAYAGEPQTVVLEVSGMVCPACPVAVRKALQRLPGVLEANADLATKRAEAKYDPDKTSPEALVKAVSNAGFGAKVVRP